MAVQRFLGLVVLAAGLVLLAFGIHASHAPLERVSNAVTGQYTDTTMWYLAGGAVATLAGALIAIFAGRVSR